MTNVNENVTRKINIKMIEFSLKNEPNRKAIIWLAKCLIVFKCEEGRTGVFSWYVIRLILFFVKREFRKLFFVTRDLRVLGD